MTQAMASVMRNLRFIAGEMTGDAAPVETRTGLTKALHRNGTAGRQIVDLLPEVRLDQSGFWGGDGGAGGASGGTGSRGGSTVGAIIPASGI